MKRQGNRIFLFFLALLMITGLSGTTMAVSAENENDSSTPVTETADDTSDNTETQSFTQAEENIQTVAEPTSKCYISSARIKEKVDGAKPFDNDDDDTEIQTSMEVTDKAEANADADDSQTEDSKISDGSEPIVTENTSSSESNEMEKMPQTDSTEELENTEERYAMDSDTNENEIASIVEKRNLFIDPNGGTYKGNSDKTSEEVRNGTVYELNEIPTRPGYTFQGWKLSGGGTLKSGTGFWLNYGTNSTSKTDKDGTAYTNYSLICKNTSNSYIWPYFGLLTYSYELNHTYQTEFDIRVNTVPTGFDHTHIKNGAFHNNYNLHNIDDIGNIVSAWNHRTMTRTFNSTIELDNEGNPQTVSPTIEFYSQLPPGKTGIFDFDIKNVTVYDVTAQKYVTSNDPNVKAGTTLVVGDNDSTVTAVWEPNTYKVSYDINGGTGTIEDQTFVYGNTAGETISATKPTKKGYTFAGWRWDDPNDETNFRLFDPGDKIPSDLQDFTLHAMWVANGYHVTFEGNGADSGTMSDEAFTYDDNAKSLTSNSFAREGYRFVGWNTKADGNGQSYTDAQAVKNLSEGGETILVNTNSLKFNQARYCEGAGGSAEDGLVTINDSLKDLHNLTSGIAYNTTVVTPGYGGVYSHPLRTFTSDFRTFFADKKMNISFKARSDKPIVINRVGFESASNRSSISLDNQ